MSTNLRVAALVASLLLAGAGGGAVSAQEALPDNLRGFSGEVRGVVDGKGEQNSFVFNVARVLQVWQSNRAGNPQALAGRAVRVGPRWVGGEKGGEWHPSEQHVAFIRTLTPGQELTLEIGNLEGSHFALLELTADQQRLAQAEAAKPATTAARDDAAALRELKAEVQRLTAEVAELRRLLAEKNR